MNSTATSAYKLPVTPPVTEVPPPALPTVIFEETQLRLAKHVAAARMLSSADSDDEETFGDQASFDAHLTGVLGEMAVRQVLEYPDEELVYVYGDGGFDLKIEGYTADVKTTSTDCFRPDLIVSAQRPLKADLYVLCHRIDPSRVRVVGYATQETVSDRRPKRFPGSRLNYVVRPDELRILR